MVLGFKGFFFFSWRFGVGAPRQVASPVSPPGAGIAEDAPGAEEVLAPRTRPPRPGAGLSPLAIQISLYSRWCHLMPVVLRAPRVSRGSPPGLWGVPPVTAVLASARPGSALLRWCQCLDFRLGCGIGSSPRPGRQILPVLEELACVALSRAGCERGWRAVQLKNKCWQDLG